MPRFLPKTPSSRNTNDTPMGLDELHAFLTERMRRINSVSGFHKTMFEGWATRLHYIDNVMLQADNHTGSNRRNLEALRKIAQESHDENYNKYIQFRDALVVLQQKVKDIEVLRLQERHYSQSSYPNMLEDISTTNRDVRAIMYQIDALIELRTDVDKNVLEG